MTANAQTITPRPASGPTPAHARPVFSTEDFALLRNAVLAHLKTIEDSPESIKYSNLYHRLGRLR